VRIRKSKDSQYNGHAKRRKKYAKINNGPKLEKGHH